MRPLIWLDIETTGLNPEQHEIIEFAAHRTTDGVECRIKIKPEHPETAHPQALEVTGYTDEKWADAIPLKEALERIAAFAKGCDARPMSAGQNVNFDLGFLKAAFKAHGIKYPFHYHSVDTMTLAHEHLRLLGQKSISLDAVCDTLGISNEGAHTALADVRRTKAVYHKLCRATWWDRFLWKRQIKRQA